MTSRPSLLVLGASSLIGQALEACNLPAPYWRVSRAAPRSPLWLTADLSGRDLSAQLAPAAGVTQVLGLAPIWTVAPSAPVLADLGVKRIVAFSSTSRWTKSRSPDPSEQAVALSLARSEDLLMETCAQRGLDWTILRPTLIYREGFDGNVSRLAGLIRRLGLLPLAGDGSGLRQPVHAEDLALGGLAALASDAARNRAYDLPGGETLTYRIMAERIFEGMGRRPRLVALPPAAWTLAFALARPFLPGATAQMGARMGQDLIFDGAAAAQDFNWSPRPFRPVFPAEAGPPGRW